MTTRTTRSGVDDTLTSSELVIESRFVGPPGIGNGGYSCGKFASLLDGPAEATLRRPVPLDTPLQSCELETGELEVADETGPIATVRPCEQLVGIDPPRRPTLQEARIAEARSLFRSESYPMRGCFVCGDRHPDGLKLHAGPLKGEPRGSSGGCRIDRRRLGAESRGS